MICKCGNIIPKKREEIGYKLCVQCSTENKWTGNLMVFHKTGNSYEIIKDPEVAEKMASMSSRNGFGSNRKSVAKKGNDTKKIIPPPENFTIDPTIINRKPPDPSKWEDESWTLAILDKFNESPEGAKKLLEEVFSDGKISPIARKRLLVIITK